ncbi:uncharacterized protein LOC130826445 [Amaranthus tricolor]|uniref:uncharacterized protein LOC130826445 n=1 Tax=Amaranthus tricolor TaxID=29722 RepID=UPI00258313D4|nr:uncharacterized protein LOC130826445 [Amaranthus tricolor]
MDDILKSVIEVLYDIPRETHPLRNGEMRTLEAKSLELANELSKYRIYVAYVQETRWKGQKAKGIKGYKLWYAGLDGKRNGVVILVSNDILKQLVEVRRCSDRIMLVRIVVREEIISIINSNGHIGRDAGNYNSVHGGFGLGARNESGENLLEFALAKELVIENSIFRKKDEHLITYKNGGHATQIDYILVRKGDRASCLDCKVVLGTEMPTQHRLLVLVFRMRKKIVEKKVESTGKIMWGRLQGDMVTTLSSKISLFGFPSQSEDANEIWMNMAKTIRKVAKRDLGGVVE